MRLNKCISGDDEVGHTPPSGLRRDSRRRKRSTSSESDEPAPRRRSRKKEHRLTARDLKKILSALQNGSSKTTSTTNVVPEFDPNNKSQDVERWLKKVNECSLIYNWDEKQIIHYALQKLSGLAKRWYESLPSVNYSWEEWQRKLRKAFPNDINYGKLLDEMLNRKSRTDETLRDYFYDKLSLLTRCEIVGRKAVDCIIYGIGDSSVRNGAQALKCEEPEDLLNFLASQQPTQSRDLSRGPATSNAFKRREFRNNFPSKNLNINKGRDLICFNCKESGHSYQNCSKPIVRCEKCHMVGHNSDSCVRKPFQRRVVETHNNNQPTDKKVLRLSADNRISSFGKIESESFKNPPVTIDLENAADNKFHKNVCVNGSMLKAYIDFGSNCSLIQQTAAENLCLTKNTNEQLPVIRGFGNSAVVPKFKSSIHIRIDEIDTELDVLVVDDAYLQTSILIGQNFTELASVTVLKDTERLFFYHTPFNVIDKRDSQNISLYVFKDVTIVKGGLVEIYTKESYTGDIYLNGDTRMGPNQEYHLNQGCYRIQEGKATLFITSLTSAPLTFKENMLIARVNPVTEAKTFLIQSDESLTPLQPLDRTQVRTGDLVSGDIRDKLYQLLEKYRNCFATNITELGCAKDAVMEIDLHDRTPVVYRPYRLSYSERQKVRDMVDELLENDIVQESNSNYASPILLVRKKNGESRLCVDYRALNAKTVKDKYPLPLIDDQLSNLSGNKFFITLDLASGYYQIAMGEGSRHLTAFVTPDGHYEFKRMPFGLANAPAVFQRTMNHMLGSRRFKTALAYMDDLLIPSSTIAEGFERLEDVLKLIQSAGLTLRLPKCSFFDTEIEYLGYQISSEGIKPSERKILAVKDFPIPRSIHEVRQFLGLASYFRRFVRGFGEIARPLTTLLKKDVQWRWAIDETKSFETLKKCLVERPLLALYNPELVTEVHTDASSLGLGGILMQWQGDPRILKPVAYFSRQTTPEERHLHSYELETLAVVCSLKKFRPYLLGLRFTVYTDCNALRTTLTKRDLIPRIARWWLLISEYDFNIEYRPGCRMSHVDALSRNPTENLKVTSSVNTNKINTDNWILTLQLADTELERIFKILKPNLDQEISDIKKNYVVKNHALHRKVGEELRLVVPKDARWQICRANHDEVGHFGLSKTLERIQSRYWFPKLRRFVKKYVSACIDCAYNKDNAARVRSGFLYPIEKVEQPFHTLHLDHLGPFVKSKTGNNYILTIVDGFTKYVFARPVKDTKTKTVIKVLDNLFIDFGIPHRIISDRGTAFTSAEFKNFCISKGTKHVLNAVACPRANGQAERFNQTILAALSTQNFGNDERDWDKQLGKVQWGINNTINATTKKCASQLMFGVTLNGPVDNMLQTEYTNTDNSGSQAVPSSISVVANECVTDPMLSNVELSDVENSVQQTLSAPSFLIDDNKSPPAAASNHSVELEKIRKEASAEIKLSQKRQKELHDSKRSPAVKYSVGDLIKITKTNFKNDGKSKKLLPKFIGPYKIIKCLGNDRYEITNVPGINNNKYQSVVAADRMRPWINIQALEINRSSGSGSTSSSTDDNSDSE